MGGFAGGILSGFGKGAVSAKAGKDGGDDSTPTPSATAAPTGQTAPTGWQGLVPMAINHYQTHQASDQALKALKGGGLSNDEYQSAIGAVHKAHGDNAQHILDGNGIKPPQTAPATPPAATAPATMPAPPAQGSSLSSALPYSALNWLSALGLGGGGGGGLGGILGGGQQQKPAAQPATPAPKAYQWTPQTGGGK